MPSDAPPTKNGRIGVFVSSTFRDMQAQRDYSNAEWRMRIAELRLGEQR